LKKGMSGSKSGSKTSTGSLKRRGTLAKSSTAWKLEEESWPSVTQADMEWVLRKRLIYRRREYAEAMNEWKLAMADYQAEVKEAEWKNVSGSVNLRPPAKPFLSILLRDAELEECVRFAASIRKDPSKADDA
jgi:hypothetical protein